MNIDAMVDAACERTGVDDFGDDTWREGLEVLVEALDTEAALNDMGVAALTDQIVTFLVNRLEIERWYADHPEIDEQQIVAPLFGLGLPRTGSTALGYLLAQDPARRSLRVWEAGTPCPPPDSATEHDDPRIAVSQAGIGFTNEMFPGFAGMIPTEADGPQECLLLLGLDFRSQIFEGMAHVPSYSDWLLGCDMTPAYRYHRRALKLLQWRCGPTAWSLRSPAHMHSITALHEVYPDARFVMTHRNVGAVLPSVCALYDTFSSVLSDKPDPLGIGEVALHVWRTSLERLLAFRATHDESRFHDLLFEDVQSDPVGSVARFYDELGEPISDVARERMQGWWDASQAARPPSHKPDVTKYGLDPSVIDEQFDFYHQRFLRRP